MPTYDFSHAKVSARSLISAVVGAKGFLRGGMTNMNDAIVKGVTKSLRVMGFDKTLSAWKIDNGLYLRTYSYLVARPNCIRFLDEMPENCKFTSCDVVRGVRVHISGDEFTIYNDIIEWVAQTHGKHRRVVSGTPHVAGTYSLPAGTSFLLREPDSIFRIGEHLEKMFYWPCNYGAVYCTGLQCWPNKEKWQNGTI